MRKILANYFYYSRGERNGVIILTALSLGILVIPKVFSIYKEPAIPIDYRAFENEILAFQNSLPPENTPEGMNEGVKASKISESELFAFNPNTASTEDFIQLGLSSRVATIISHYREKGGRFYRKEDFKKIYGITSEDYNRLEGFIALDEDAKSSMKYNYDRPVREFGTGQYETPLEIKLAPFDPNNASELALLSLGLDKNTVKNVLKYREKGGKFYKKEDLKRIYGFSDLDYLRIENYIQIADNHTVTNYNSITNVQNDLKKNETIKIPSIIDVNKATSEEWLQLRGIGATFAARIIEQREKLGGFASLDQLKEIHGLPDSTFRNITPYLKFSTNIYRKISVNKANSETITHPYLTRKQVDVIARFRLNHGSYKNIEDLKKTGVLTNEALEKLKPYLIFE